MCSAFQEIRVSSSTMEYHEDLSGFLKTLTDSELEANLNGSGSPNFKLL